MRRLIIKHGGQKPCLRIARRVFTALADPAGVHAHRAGALERVGLLLEDWTHAHARLADTEARMLGVLDELHLSELVSSIPGVSALGAAAILAQSGDPRRFITARALVKHAGLAPRQNLSGTFIGRTKLTGQGRPGLCLAAWRTVCGAHRANPVYAARYQHLTTREKQAQSHPGANGHRRGHLRHLHAVISTGQRWDPLVATHGTRALPPTTIAA